MNQEEKNALFILIRFLVSDALFFMEKILAVLGGWHLYILDL